MDTAVYVQALTERIQHEIASKHQQVIALHAGFAEAEITKQQLQKQLTDAKEQNDQLRKQLQELQQSSAQVRHCSRRMYLQVCVSSGAEQPQLTREV